MSEKKETPANAGRENTTEPPSGEAKVHPLTGKPMAREVNGPKGPEPTRYGDWEQKGRCSDF